MNDHVKVLLDLSINSTGITGAVWFWFLSGLTVLPGFPVSTLSSDFGSKFINTFEELTNCVFVIDSSNSNTCLLVNFNGDSGIDSDPNDIESETGTLDRSINSSSCAVNSSDVPRLPSSIPNGPGFCFLVASSWKLPCGVVQCDDSDEDIVLDSC